MRVIENIFELEENLQESYVAIGTFDGVHYGHQKLIRNAVEKAKKNGGKSVVFTFSSHPMELIDISRAPRVINTIESDHNSNSVFLLYYHLGYKIQKKSTE